ncbi:MAG: transporter substrate-binding domain-containing protein, partial [Endozoicomonas sp.]
MFGLPFKRIITSALLTSTVILAGCSSDSAPESQVPKQNMESVVKVGMSGTYYPFTFMERGELQGFEVDLWKEVGSRLESEVEFVTAPFSGLF